MKVIKSSNQESYYLVISGSYRDLSIGLGHSGVLVDTFVAKEVRASADLIPFLDSLLLKNKLTLSDISFIALNQGPGAFTSLRVVITTVNGIACASGIPLVGCDGLLLLLAEALSQMPKNAVVVALLQAYNNEVYVVAEQGGNIVISPSVMKVDALIEVLAGYKDDVVYCVGNGATVYQEQLVSALPQLKKENISEVSLSMLTAQSWENWQKGQSSSMLQPLYLKTQKFVKTN